MSLNINNVGVELVKVGQAVDLLKQDSSLKILNVALGWDANPYNGFDFDLDVTAFLLTANEKCRDAGDIVFYNRPEHVSGAVKHSGDEKNGSKQGDDEVITVNLAKIPSDIEQIVGVITIYEGQDRKQTFGKVKNAYARLDNAETSNPLVKVDLTEEFSKATAIEAFRVYKYNGSWRFKAIGEGYESGLAEFVEKFGLSVKGERK